MNYRIVGIVGMLKAKASHLISGMEKDLDELFL